MGLWEQLEVGLLQVQLVVYRLKFSLSHCSNRNVQLALYVQSNLLVKEEAH